MRSIERLVRDALSEFLSLDERHYLEADHSELLRLLTSEQWIRGDKWLPTFEVFSDYGLTSELGRFVDEFGLWSRQVAEIREQWLFDHVELSLPEDYLSVFGHTSDIVTALEPMLNRCRRIVRRIDELHASKPEPPQAEPQSVPHSSGIAITEKALWYLEAARELGAVNGVMVSGVEIAQRALDRGQEVPRRTVASLKRQGLIETKEGKGTTLTPKAVEYLRQRTQV